MSPSFVNKIGMYQLNRKVIIAYGYMGKLGVKLTVIHESYRGKPSLEQLFCLIIIETNYCEMTSYQNFKF